VAVLEVFAAVLLVVLPLPLPPVERLLEPDEAFGEADFLAAELLAEDLPAEDPLLEDLAAVEDDFGLDDFAEDVLLPEDFEDVFFPVPEDLLFVDPADLLLEVPEELLPEDLLLELPEELLPEDLLFEDPEVVARPADDRFADDLPDEDFAAFVPADLVLPADLDEPPPDLDCEVPVVTCSAAVAAAPSTAPPAAPARTSPMTSLALS